MLTRVRSRLAEEHGMTVPEVLLVAVMFTLVLGAALTPFVVMGDVDRKTQAQNDTQQNARNTIGGIAFNLRNLAGQSQLVERANAYDLVFQTVDRQEKPSGSQNSRNIMRVRYCLDTTNGEASASNGVIWQQSFKWTSAAVPSSMPSSSNCPDVTWAGSTRRSVAYGITNKIGNQDRPLFTYFPVATPPATTPLTQITSVRIDLYADSDPTDTVKETRLTSGVLLRNQNGAPTATATAAAVTTRQVRLDATASDPESLPLTYRWCDLSANPVCDDTTRIGTGQSYTHTFDSTVPTNTSRNMQLVVTDAGGLEAVYPFTVLVPQ